MTVSQRRNTAGQVVQLGIEGTADVFRVPFGINPTWVPNFTQSPDFGSKANGEPELVSEQTDAAIDANGIPLAALPLVLCGLLGKPVKQAIVQQGGIAPSYTYTPITSGAGEPLYRYTFTDLADLADDEISLFAELGDGRYSQRTGGARTKELTLSVSKNDGNATMSGALIGKALEIGLPLVGQSLATIGLAGVPDAGAFSLRIGTRTVGPIAFDADLEEVQTHLDAQVGAGKVVVATYQPVLGGGYTLGDYHGHLVTDGLFALLFPGFPGAIPTVTVPTNTLMDTTATPDAPVIVAVTVVGDGTYATRIQGGKLNPAAFAVQVGPIEPSVAFPRVNGGTFHTGGMELAWADFYQAFHDQDGSGPGPTDFSPGERKRNFTIWVEGDKYGLGVIENARAQGEFFVSGSAKYANGYEFVVVAKVKVAGIEPLGDKSGRYGYAVTFSPVPHDNYNGGNLQVSVVCDVNLASISAGANEVRV